MVIRYVCDRIVGSVVVEVDVVLVEVRVLLVVGSSVELLVLVLVDVDEVVVGKHRRSTASQRAMIRATRAQRRERGALESGRRQTVFASWQTL